MKKQIFKNIILSVLLMGVLVLISSCSDEETKGGPAKLSKITSISDMNTPLTSVNLGDFVALQGENMEFVNSIQVNDVEVDMLETYFENGVRYMQIPVKMASEIDNKIKVTTPNGTFAYDIMINIPDIKVTGLLNEYAFPGDTATLKGDFFTLYEVDSLNTVIYFGDKPNPVIKANATSLTVKVPDDLTGNNVPIKLVNSKFNASALAQYSYRDTGIETFLNFDDKPTKNNDGINFWNTQWTNPRPVSGKYALFNLPNGTQGWDYVFGSTYKYTDDMLAHPEKYVLKFEEIQIVPMMSGSIFVYNSWQNSPAELTAADFAVKYEKQWETIFISLDKILNEKSLGTLKTPDEFNWRHEIWGKKVLMGFDNFRVDYK